MDVQRHSRSAALDTGNMIGYSGNRLVEIFQAINTFRKDAHTSLSVESLRHTSEPVAERGHVHGS